MFGKILSQPPSISSKRSSGVVRYRTSKQRNQTRTITFLSTWPEVPDGIATFAQQLASHLPGRYRGWHVRWNVLELRRFPKLHEHSPNRIIGRIQYDRPEDYRQAAAMVNASRTDLIVIQFIYPIYGEFGRMLFEFIDRVTKPVVIILHSVPTHERHDALSNRKRQILREFARRNIPVIAQSDTARQALLTDLHFLPNAVARIYHSAPTFARINQRQRQLIRQRYGIEPHEFLVFLYGIFRPDKGITDLLAAVKELSLSDSPVHLLLVGSDQENGRYLAHVRQEISTYGLRRAVTLRARFMTEAEIGRLLQAADCFVTAQRGLGLHSSGTLAYALAAGAAIISTPTVHARELLPGRGLIVPAERPDDLARAIRRFIDHPDERRQFRRNARRLGSTLVWEKSARRFLKVFFKALRTTTS